MLKMSADPLGIVVLYKRIVFCRARWAMKHHFNCELSTKENLRVLGMYRAYWVGDDLDVESDHI